MTAGTITPCHSRRARGRASRWLDLGVADRWLFAAADMDQLLGVVADIRRRADAA